MVRSPEHTWYQEKLERGESRVSGPFLARFWPVFRPFWVRVGVRVSAVGLGFGLGLGACLDPTIGSAFWPENVPDPGTIHPKSLSRRLHR